MYKIRSVDKDKIKILAFIVKDILSQKMYMCLLQLMSFFYNLEKPSKK